LLHACCAGTRHFKIADVLQRFFRWLKNHPVAALGSTLIAAVASWVGQQLSNLFEHAAYTWILDRAQALFAQREAVIIASAASYVPGIVTGTIVFVGVFWIWTHASWRYRPQAILAASPESQLARPSPAARIIYREQAPALIAALVLVCMVVGIASAYRYNKAHGFPSVKSQFSSLKEKLISTAFRNVFTCKSIKQEMSKEEHEKELGYFRQKEKIIDEFYGLVIKPTE
jgi:hypothetical protein